MGCNLFPHLSFFKYHFIKTFSDYPTEILLLSTSSHSSPVTLVFHNFISYHFGVLFIHSFKYSLNAYSGLL